MTPRFHLPSAPGPGEIAILEGEEHHHLRNVLRLAPGDPVSLFDGCGRGFGATILEVSRSETRIRIDVEETPSREPGMDLTLIVALPRGEKFDLVIQKSTELGVGSILPVISSRSEVRIVPGRDARKLDRWRRIALEACKQSGRSRIPSIASPAPLASILGRRVPGPGILFHPGEPGEGGIPGNLLAGARSAACAVGPEGGWSPGEVADFQVAEFRSASLGPLILRAETAAIVATALLIFLAGGLGSALCPESRADNALIPKA